MRKVKPIWILLKQETVSGSGISWALCKSPPHSREKPCQHPTTQFFTGRMPFLPPNQQRQSTEGIYKSVDIYMLNRAETAVIVVDWQIAREHRIPFLETSAKSNINVEKAFLDLAQAILNKVCRPLAL